MLKQLSLESSKKLVGADIVLETEKWWRENTFSIGDKKFTHNMLCPSNITVYANILEDKKYPAPDTIELLSELTDLNLIDYALNFNIHVTVIMRDVEKLAQCLLWVKSKEVPHVRD